MSICSGRDNYYSLLLDILIPPQLSHNTTTQSSPESILTPPQLSTLDKSFPVPSGRTATGGGGVIFCLSSSDRTQPTWTKHKKGNISYISKFTSVPPTKYLSINHTLFIIIIFPYCSYESALVCCSLPTLLLRRDEACRRFISNIKESGFLSHLLLQPTNVAHGYGLRSGFSCSEFRFVRTDQLSNFVTHSYNRI